MSNEVNVLYQTSDYYAPIAGTGIISLLKNNRKIEKLNIYVMDDGITKENRDKLISVAKEYDRNITFLDASIISSRLEKLGVAKWRNTYTMYCKLFASSLLPDTLDRILYLDSDTMVNEPLDELFSADLTGSPCAMVMSPNYNKHKTFIGLTEEDNYFEAGTIYFNLEYWRRHNCESEIVNYVKNPDSKYYAADQDILNFLYGKIIKKLPLKFGTCSVMYLFNARQIYKIYDLNEQRFYSEEEINSAKQKPYICHFSGGGINGRPWEKGNKQPKGDLWGNYLAESPWRDWPPTEPKATSFQKMQKIAYKILPSPIYAALHRQALHSYFRKRVAELVKERKTEKQ